MSSLKSLLSHSFPQLRSRIHQLRKSHGSHPIASLKIHHLLSGLHGIPVLFHATSKLDPEQGLFLRSIPIRQVSGFLPKLEADSIQPTIESIFWFILTGQKPTVDDVTGLKNELIKRSEIKGDLEAFLHALPKDLSPMAQFSMALLFLSKSSVFRQKLSGVKKDDIWELVLEDGLDLLAKTPAIFSQIAKNRGNKTTENPSNDADWCRRLADTFGINTPEGHDFMRLFSLLHVDHEGGNVSTHTTMAASSAHADPFSAYSAGVNGLSGALHGYANRDVMLFILKLMQDLGSNPLNEQIEDFALKWRKAKGTIPGFGHAILRNRDLRFCIFEEWASTKCVDSDVLRVNRRAGEVVSEMLKKQGKVKNPYPNIDFNSGSLLYHYGVKDIELYPVFFAVVRAFGCVANMVIERAIGLPIEYPLSMDLPSVETNFGINNKGL